MMLKLKVVVFVKIWYFSTRYFSCEQMHIWYKIKCETGDGDEDIMDLRTPRTKQ